MTKRSLKKRASRLPHWFIKLCRWLWGRQKLFWSTVILSLVLNVFSSLLFVKWPWSTNSDLDGTFIKWAFHNSIIILVSGIMFFLLLCIIYLASSFEIENHIFIEEMEEAEVVSNEEVKKYYLERIIRNNEILILKGIPAGLINRGVQLEEVFIPLQFLLNQPIVEYPLTKRELENLYELLEKDQLHEEVERVLFEAEKNWYRHTDPNKRINIDDLWKSLTIEKPAAVIQGYPGMGKSTLMARLSLHMARCCLNHPDPTMMYHLEPSLLPVVLNLGSYATRFIEAKQSNQFLSLSSYLEFELQKLNIVGLTSYIQMVLRNGSCLVLFDGLDEISDLKMRRDTQEAIRNFILENGSNQEGKDNFNRFLITSRVAGYDLNAFPAYEHFTITELTSDQIKGFLPRWCRANAKRDYNTLSDHQDEEDEAITNEAAFMQSQLNLAVTNHQGVRELVENPLLLTLLAVMQQNSIELPRERVELYKVVTRTLLENRNIAKGLPTIPEAQAIQRLGPIAFYMQEIGNSFIRQSSTLDSLKQTIFSEEGGTADQVTQEAEKFLYRIRERSGLFVLRTGDYFGFFHRTFQEYFSARYMLNQIKSDPDHWILEFARKASLNDDLWREPFLLAVAYKSSDDEVIARQMLQTLLTVSEEGNIESRSHNLLLAVDCLIEVKPLTIGALLEQQVAKQLLDLYKEAQECKNVNVCKKIERSVSLWLLNLPKEAYRPAILIVLNDLLSNTQHLTLQHATLVILARIANKLTKCPPVLFHILIPTLLSLSSLPAIGDCSPSTNLLPSSNPTFATLATLILSFMDKQGPNGQMLAYTRQYFEAHPENLRFLAQYSLTKHSFIMPVVTPKEERNYARFCFVIKQWASLCKKCEKKQITDIDVEECVNIYCALLNSVEEISYPSMLDLINLLELRENDISQPWKQKQVWQSYLSNQLLSASYIRYQQIILLWCALFSETSDADILIGIICDQMDIRQDKEYYPAESFLAMISTYRVNLKTLENFEDMHSSIEEIIQTTIIYDKIDLQVLIPKDIATKIVNSDTKAVKIELDMKQIFLLRDVLERKIIDTITIYQDLRVLLFLKYLRETPILRIFKGELIEEKMLGFADLFLKRKIADQAMKRIIHGNNVGPDEIVDLLRILLGRIFQIRSIDRYDETVIHELHQLAKFAYQGINLSRKEETEVRLDIIRSMPTRFAEEITLVLQIVKETDDEQVHLACAKALMDSTPQTLKAMKVLEGAIQSPQAAISMAAKRRLEQKN